MPTPPKVTWKGAIQLTRVGRGRWLFSPQEVVCVIRYKGPYGTCLSSMPLIGNTIAGYTGYGVKVDHTELEEGDGSTGLLTITLRNPNTDLITLQSGGSGSAPAAQIGQAGDGLPELQWNPFRRLIESHPLCGTNSAAGSTTTATSSDGHIPQASYVPVSGGWTYAQYKSLLTAGETSYDEHQPVLGLTTEWYTKPTNFGQNNYQPDTPPTDQGLVFPQPINGAGAWVWIRGGDSLTRQNNRWHLHQDWTGYRPGSDLTTYNLLYGTGGGGSGS